MAPYQLRAGRWGRTSAIKPRITGGVPLLSPLPFIRLRLGAGSVGKSLIMDHFNSWLAITGNHLNQRSKWLLYLRSGMPKSLGSGSAGRPLLRDHSRTRLALTGCRLHQHSRRLRYLRSNSPKGLGAGLTGRSLHRDRLRIRPANTGHHLHWRPSTSSGVRRHSHQCRGYIIHNTFDKEARPAIRPVFRSLYPAHIDTDYLYPANWKM